MTSQVDNPAMEIKIRLDRADPLKLRKTHTIILNEGNREAKRAEILDYFHRTYTLDEKLLEVLRDDETFYRRADPLRHPLIFYLGHTAVFYINKLVIAHLLESHQRINPRFESLFAVGVDEMSWDDLNESHYDWPAVSEVRRYRDQVRHVVDELIRTLPLEMPINWTNPWWAIMMGIEHARIHLETSSVLIRQLPIERVQEHPYWPLCTQSGPTPDNELLDVPGGKVHLGKSKEPRLYGWDNEFGRHEVDVPAFKASKYLVSNGEFLDFVNDAGYETSKWWTEEGWRWRNYRQARHPLFWIAQDKAHWKLRTFVHEIDMPWDWPVEVNYLEAKAFCNWLGAKTGKSLRLPTEDEWYRLRDYCNIADQPDWIDAPGNINLEHFASSCPVNRFAFGAFYDVIGNVWQWTETPITGFDGFEAHPFYDDFSTPTFDNLHNLIKGGSWISTGNEATRDSRYAFRRHFFQHAGLRYVESDAPVVIPVQDLYETDETICMYSEFHWGDEHFCVGNFPRRMAQICLELTEGLPRRKALDLGCAAGRATFELARSFALVQGVDFTARYIQMGTTMKERGRIKYIRKEEGELTTFCERRLSDFQLQDVAASVEFWQADACNLREQFTGYDLVLAANLLDRLYSPRKFLAAIHERIHPGGLLVISSPYTWMKEFTPRLEWIGAFRKDGEPYSTLEALNDILGEHFEHVGNPRDIEFVIPETARKFQHTIAQITVWKRK